MSSANSSSARYGVALVVFVGIGMAVWCAERLIGASDPDLLWRDPVSGDNGMMFYHFHPELGLFHKPGFTGTYQGIEYTINSLGVRGAETHYERTDGVPRIALLGDSVAWGFGVPDGQSLADHLAREWRPSEVINLSVAGYGTGQELMLLRHEGLRYQPDLVVLIFTVANDVEDTYFPDSAASYPANLFHLADGELRIDRFESSGIERLGMWLSHNSFIVSYLARGLRDRGSRAQPASGRAQEMPRDGVGRSAVGRANRARLAALEPKLVRYAELHYLVPASSPEKSPPVYSLRGGLLRPSALNHYKVELVKQVLLEISRTSLAAGANFTIALAPYAAQLDDKARANPLHQEIVRYLKAEEIPVVDLLPMLRESSVPTEALYIDAMHFSSQGNRVVAKILASAIPRPSDRARLSSIRSKPASAAIRSGDS